MRLRRLDLIRYGKFTDYSINFGQRVASEPDLHIVYGPNEAGKSTMFSAFLDLLFGIGTQSPFDFIHPYSTMRIGGALELGGAAREFARIKRRQNSLLGPDDQPIPESAIRGDLGGIERDAYRMMFSLDDETLEKGGESILASKGDLGQLLFSASAGLGHLSDKLNHLRGEADEFYRYRARGGILVDLKARLSELKSAREELDTLATDHAILIETRNRASLQYDEAIAERTRIQARIDELQRVLVALPRLGTLLNLRMRLEPLADLPEIPTGWTSELSELQKAEIEIDVQARALCEEVRRLQEEVDAIVVDEAALELAERVARFVDLRARYVTAEKDLPERRLQHREVDLAIAGILQRIEREAKADPSRLVLSASTVGRLRELIEARSGIDAAHENAAKELAETQRRFDEASAKLPERASDAKVDAEYGRAIAVLAVTVETLRSADHSVRSRIAQRTKAAALHRLEEDLLALNPPWQGSADDLARMRCPSSEMVSGWKVARRDSEKTLRGHEAEVERLTTMVGRLESERTALASTTGVVTDHEAVEIRSRREQAWAAHRRDLASASADIFEAALRHDDIVTAGRYSHMSDLAKLHQSEQALDVARADLKRSVELKDRAAAALAKLDGEIKSAAHIIAQDLAQSSLPELEDWLSLRQRALEAREAVQSAEQDLLAARADAEEVTNNIRTALHRAAIEHQPDAEFEALLALAQSVLDREAELRLLRSELDEKKRDLHAREHAVEQARAQEEGWAAAWSNACQSCWLGDTDELPTIGMVREVLSAIVDLGPAIEKRAGLVDRIGKMERDQVTFREELTDIAKRLNVSMDDRPVLDLAQRVADVVRSASMNRDRRANLTETLGEAKERQRTLAETTEIHAQQKARMIEYFEVASLADVSGELSAIQQRRDLRERAEEAEREIVDAMRAPNLARAEAALAATDQSSLEAELIELKARFDDQDKRCHELFAARSAAIDKVEAIGGDARVAEIEERRRTTLLEIEDGAVRYLQLRAGVAATDQALATYRERHRSSMMMRASEAFKTISRGAYTGLATQPGKDGETLIALSVDGGSKVADELSKGTRFQLYLALRVSGYHEFARTRGTVPFVADDIMETFDDFRAEEAFRLFAEMAKVGQVIYLTHHQHLCEIARKVCPTARVHHLAEYSTALL